MVMKNQETNVIITIIASWQLKHLSIKYIHINVSAWTHSYFDLIVHQVFTFIDFREVISVMTMKAHCFPDLCMYVFENINSGIKFSNSK